MANITHYSVLFYGGNRGYQDNRAQIALYTSGTSSSFAYLRFRDTGAGPGSGTGTGSLMLPPDEFTGGRIVMYLPSSMLDSVLTALRNEAPIECYWASDRGFLSTGSREPVGEAE